MPVVKRIKRRGATITVEAYAEVLFMPAGDVYNWTNRFTGRIRSKTIQAAPSNKRPRWSHYGKPLRQTIVSARPRFWGNGRDKQRVYSAVGSTAPHAYFVDQGTGVFAGNGPYEAKILPPWQHGGASLYERTWRPGGPGTRRVAPVMIKGQKGQFFFDRGLRAAFQSMRMRSAQLPGDGGPKITEALASMPSGLENFMGSGNTSANPAFVGQLNEWRKWRDEAWNSGEGLGHGGGVGSRAHERAVAASRGKPRKPKSTKAPVKPKRPPKPKPDKGGYETLRDKQTAAVTAFTRQNPNVEVVGRITAGLVVVAPATGQRVVIPWSRLYNLL
jgi:hypothetical protein